MNLRELKYIIYGEDRLSNKLKSISSASDKTTSALGNNSNKLLGKFKDSFSSLDAKFPMIGKGIGAIASPVGLVATGVLAIGAGLNKAIDSAAEFNGIFRDLQNMNLDKTKTQISDLKRTVIDTAFTGGFDAGSTSTGFYDVQSITGKYGKEVEEIVAKQGKFAQVMKANFNEWIAGSAKAMANYGFNADELDRYNKSAAATVQVGVTTYDQYAKVSSVFAGSAAAANQNYDSANKLFALYTKKTKSVDEAATLVKSAFNDLFKSSTIDAFKKVGIDLFDVNGKAKQVDVIMKELNHKFATAKNDKAMNNLRNQFTGSEGLIALIQTASDKSGDMLRSFDAFDNTSFDFNAALKAAQEDLNYINDQVNNKLKTAWISLGQAILPIWIPIKKLVVGILDSIKEMLDLVTGDYARKKDKESLDYSQSSVENKYKETITNASKLSESEYAKIVMDLGAKIGYQQSVVASAIKNNTNAQKTASLKGELIGLKNVLNQLGLARAGIQPAEAAKPEGSIENPDGTSDEVGKKGLEAVSGGGARVRNINVTITKIMDDVNIVAATVKEGAAELRQIIIEEMTRAINGFEQAIND